MDIDIGKASFLITCGCLAVVTLIALRKYKARNKQLGPVAGQQTTPPPQAAAANTQNAAAGQPWYHPEKWFDKEDIPVILAYVFLEFTIWKTFPGLGMFNGWGWLHVPVYGAAVIIISRLLKMAKGGRRAFGLAVMFISLAIFGTAHVVSAIVQWRSSPPTVTVRLNGCVPVAQHSVPFGSTPVLINLEGRCGVDAWYDGHCLWIKRAQWTNDTQPHRVCGGNGYRDVEWAWSADVPFVGAIALRLPH